MREWREQGGGRAEGGGRERESSEKEEHAGVRNLSLLIDDAWERPPGSRGRPGTLRPAAPLISFAVNDPST